MDPLVLGSDLYDVHIYTIIEVIGGYTCYLLLCFLNAQHLYNCTLPLFMSFSIAFVNRYSGRPYEQYEGTEGTFDCKLCSI